MTSSPISIQKGELANRALDLMENRKSQITILPVLNDKDEFRFFKASRSLKCWFFSPELSPFFCQE